MKNLLSRLLLLATLALLAPAAPAQDAVKSEWKGFPRLDFVVDGRPCILVAPLTPAEKNPWIWRTEFFDAAPEADLALLAKGYHVAYIDMQDMYGSPTAMGYMDKFYDYLTATYGLSKRCVLEGFSRGGLFAFNWASLHPDRVASIYVDAPVCDIKSWPGAKGKSPGSAGDWEKCKAIYGFKSEGRAVAYRHNPVDNVTLKPMADAKVPILAVCGDADTVVPMEENILIVEKRYQALGGEIQIITKPGVGHHPHSLEDPTPIVDFVLAHP